MAHRRDNMLAHKEGVVMELTSVTCNNCGGALQISDSARFVTCRYCNAQLEIKRNQSAIATEVLNRIDQSTAHMADDLSAIRRESELERLDREWSLRRENLLIRRKNGTSAAPAATIGYIMIVSGGVLGLVGFIMFSLFATVFAALIHGSGAPGIFSLIPCVLPLFVLGIIAINTVIGIGIIRAARNYQAEERRYLERRQALLASISNDVPPPLRT